MRTIGLNIWIYSSVYVLLWIPIAWKIRVLFPSQMLQENYPRQKVIPLVVDFFVWADLCILCPLLGFIVSAVGEKWIHWRVFDALLLGFVLAILMQRFVIQPGKYPCSLGGANRTNVLGLLHLPFFAFAAAMILLFVITPASTRDIFIVAGTLALFIPTAILAPLHFTKKWFGYKWIPEVFKEEQRLYWMIGGAWFVLAVLTGLKIAFQ